MNKLTRVKAFFIFIMFVFFGLASLFFGFLEVKVYFLNSDIVLLSKFDLVIFLLSFMFFAVSTPAFYFFIFNKEMPHRYLYLLMRFIVFWFVISLIIGIAFSFFYSVKLERDGYIQCRGIPSGWMPGMATKYVLDESLCH